VTRSYGNEVMIIFPRTFVNQGLSGLFCTPLMCLTSELNAPHGSTPAQVHFGERGGDLEMWNIPIR